MDAYGVRVEPVVHFRNETSEERLTDRLSYLRQRVRCMPPTRKKAHQRILVRLLTYEHLFAIDRGELPMRSNLFWLPAEQPHLIVPLGTDSCESRTRGDRALSMGGFRCTIMLTA